MVSTIYVCGVRPVIEPRQLLRRTWFCLNSTVTPVTSFVGSPPQFRSKHSNVGPISGKKEQVHRSRPAIRRLERGLHVVKRPHGSPDRTRAQNARLRHHHTSLSALIPISSDAEHRDLNWCFVHGRALNSPHVRTSHERLIPR